jgi:nucleoside-diphosphate-sugar epimerase
MGSPTFLVTGALGCIGAWTCRRLVRDDASVIGFDVGQDTRRLAQITHDYERARVTLVQGDIADLATIESVVDRYKITHVIHLAALQIPACRANPSLGAKVNVVGTVNIFEAARTRGGQIESIAYASSIGMFAVSDTDRDGLLRADTEAHPTSLYGVYKQANEGTARVYWEEAGVSSVGLRPLTVYGVGRDQGLTSGPTKAIAAAVLGTPFRVPFGGPTLFQYADDVAAALIAAARSRLPGAPVFNLPGQVIDGPRLVESIEAAVPESAGLVDFTNATLPLPWMIDTTGIEVLNLPEPTPFEDGVLTTATMYRELHARNELTREQFDLATP